MRNRSIRKLKPLIYPLIFFFIWTNLGIYNLVYAATNDSKQNAVGSKQKEKTAEEKFQEALEKIRETEERANEKIEKGEDTEALVASNGQLTGLLSPNSEFTDSPLHPFSDSPILVAQATNLPTSADLSETIEVQFTDDIKAKATELNYNPVKIYEWVRFYR